MNREQLLHQDALPEYRGARCSQRGQQDPHGDVYVAPAWLVGPTRSEPVVTLDVIPGRCELSLDDARAVRDALDTSIRWHERRAT